MKILILSSKLPFPPKDGGAIATLSLAEGLADNGHEIHMLCLNTRKHSFDVKRIPAYLQEKISFYAIDHDTSIRPVSAAINLFFSSEPYNAKRFHSKEYEIKLASMLVKILPDVVQIEGPYMGYCIPVIRKHSTAMISLRAHNVEHEIWQRKAANTFHPLLKFYFNILSGRIKKLEEKVLLHVDLLVTISERDRNQLVQWHEIRSITIPTGLNPDRYPPPASPVYPSLFYIGALDWMPNQEGLFWFIEQIFIPLKNTLPGLEFNIAGRNAPSWLEEKLRKISDSGINYHGEVENAYVFMNQYAIFVSPLLTGSGIRIKILEGMIMQRAVVATSIAAEGISVTDGENIFIADSPEAMSKIIYELCNNREKYEFVARNSRDFVIENFNTLATSKRLSEFYRSNLS